MNEISDRVDAAVLDVDALAVEEGLPGRVLE